VLTDAAQHRAQETPHSMLKIENLAAPDRRVRAGGKALSLKGLWLLTRDALYQWFDDNPFQMGAAPAYYTLFSMAPLLLIAIAVAGLAFEREASQNQIIGMIEGVVGFQRARDPGDS
jgi:uncharacterized BrkB/YihY/UPF0761 family membrane protein